ncbi:MAG: Panacea domain-containing protein [Clostridia bacterium]|nr:Panacea domain-containing protein [Clostridia bacterium]
MIIDFEKINTIASYCAEKTTDLYVTKFLKFCYYLDFISYNQRGASVTNDIYYKLPYGPVPSFIKNEIDNLEGVILGKESVSQLSKSIALQTGKGDFGKVIVNRNKRYNLKKLSEYELKLLDEIIKTFKGYTARKLSAKTHREKPYIMSSENSVIDYELAKYLDIKKILPNLV